ncbi:MAG: DoxX family membrane protein [Woeseiaceae bacterium]|nr:DoxX family membrane protein [Woeseiaceae bacterium]NIP21939.1 DoxX family membrane protein [Woeseiaceae bacterium]NIS91024.1 DoxX family membrane protein [Woeseiaceae bacterium]
MPNNTDYAALILRIGLGAMFVAHGLLKVFVFTLPGTVGFFEQVGFPGWTAYVVTFAEIGGGILLLAGVAVRAVSIALIPVLLGATFVHWGFGWVFSNPNGGWEYPVFLTLAAVVQALLGPGVFALRFPLRREPVAA